jgi:IclR family transcriptional regulator, pca regulon regulatory protein
MPKLAAHTAARRRASGHESYFVEALARGLEVIRAFGSERNPMTLSEVARRTGLSKPTVRRMLLTLCDTGYFEVEGASFRPGPGVLSLATAYLGTDVVTTVLQPTCERLMVQTQETCFVAVMDGMEVVRIANANPRFPLGLQPSIGARMPALSTAAGRAMLSTLSDVELDRHLKAAKPESKTPFTETDKARLREKVLRARAEGFATTRQEMSMGYCGVAVPLRRHDGRLHGALSLTPRVERLDADPQLSSTLAALLQNEAAALATQLI